MINERMKHYIVTIEAFEESPGGDVRLFACEEHKLILSDDEELLGVCMVYNGSEPLQIDQDS